MNFEEVLIRQAQLLKIGSAFFGRAVLPPCQHSANRSIVIMSLSRRASSNRTDTSSQYSAEEWLVADPTAYSHALPSPPRLSSPGSVTVDAQSASHKSRKQKPTYSWYPPSRPPVGPQLNSTSDQASEYVDLAKNGILEITDSIDGRFRRISGTLSRLVGK